MCLLVYVSSPDKRKDDLPPVEADEDVPQISLEEMLDDLNLEDPTGGAGAAMQE